MVSKMNRNKHETDLVSVIFGLNRNFFYSFRGHPSSDYLPTVFFQVDFDYAQKNYHDLVGAVEKAKAKNKPGKYGKGSRFQVGYLHRIKMI